MAVPSSSSVQRARQELAEHLREIRRDAGLTARALSVAAGWHEAKTSRIESAKQAPSDADIRTWCEVCDVGHRAADLIATSRATDSMYIEWRRLQRTGMRRLHESRVPLYERTRLFRDYSPNVVPGFFQTPEYAYALMSSIRTFHGFPDDTEEAVAARMKRNTMLFSGERRLIMVLEESVLRHRFGDRNVMTEQLSHLLRVVTLPSMSLGVIPFSADERPMWPIEGFMIFDDARVHVELLSAAVTVVTPSEVKLYVRAFEDLAKLALYGVQARALIIAAIDSLK